MHISIQSMVKTYVKFQKNRYNSRKMTKFSVKINLWIISKPHAHLQNIIKTYMYVKLQKNRNKTVGGVAHIRYPLSIHFHCQNSRKNDKVEIAKEVPKVNLRIIPKTTCTFSKQDQDICKISKDSE